MPQKETIRRCERGSRVYGWVRWNQTRTFHISLQEVANRAHVSKRDQSPAYLPLFLLRVVRLIRILRPALARLREHTGAVFEELDVEGRTVLRRLCSCRRPYSTPRRLHSPSSERGREVETAEAPSMGEGTVVR
jgi:hypothetical protein